MGTSADVLSLIWTQPCLQLVVFTSLLAGYWP
jgi:hypothetical protein